MTSATVFFHLGGMFFVVRALLLLTLWSRILPAAVEPPAWLDDPLPFFVAAEEAVFGSEPEGDAEKRKRFLEWGIAWSREVAQTKTAAPSQPWPAPGDDTYATGLDFIVDTVRAASVETKSIIGSYATFRLTGRAERMPSAMLPLPQAWVDRKLLALAFLYRIEVLGLISEDIWADRRIYSPIAFLAHDDGHFVDSAKLLRVDGIDLLSPGALLNGSNLEIFFGNSNVSVLVPAGDAKSFFKIDRPVAREFADLFRACFWEVRDALAADIGKLRLGTIPLNTAYRLLHEAFSLSLPDVVAGLRNELGPGSFAVHFPATQHLLHALGRRLSARIPSSRYDEQTGFTQEVRGVPWEAHFPRAKSIRGHRGSPELSWVLQKLASAPAKYRTPEAFADLILETELPGKRNRANRHGFIAAYFGRRGKSGGYRNPVAVSQACRELLATLVEVPRRGPSSLPVPSAVKRVADAP